MEPSASFLRELRLMDEALSVRFVPWRELAEGDRVSVWPVKGQMFFANPADLPQRGRFVIFERNRISGRLERVFDVVYPDGWFMPLDRRSLEGLSLRRNWSNLGGRGLAELARETMEREKAARKAETRSALENSEPWSRSMEQLFREDTGHAGSFALGAPGAPAAHRIGRKTSGVQYEDTAAAPPAEVKPPVDKIQIAYE